MICTSREQIGGMEKFQTLCIMCSQAFENDMMPETMFFGSRLVSEVSSLVVIACRGMRPVTRDLLETLIFAPY